VDGVVSVRTARLTLCRMTDPGRFPEALAWLRHSMTVTPDRATFFARGHRFTAEAVMIEQAEYARAHKHDLGTAAQLYGRVARSRFPLQRVLGLLGAGLIAVERDTDRGALLQARDLAGEIDARLVARHATAALGLPGGDRPHEVFFC
jgi:hypothetical protein